MDNTCRHVVNCSVFPEALSEYMHTAVTTYLGLCGRRSLFGKAPPTQTAPLTAPRQPEWSKVGVVNRWSLEEGSWISYN